jgi:hypothetical protein
VSTNLDKFRSDLDKLVALGANMGLDLAFQSMQKHGRLDKQHEEDAKKLAGSFEENYQRWFTEADAVLKQLLPDRLDEFSQLYRPDPKRKQIDAVTYRIQDWMNGTRSGKNDFGEPYFNDLTLASMKFKTQIEILNSVRSRFESSLHDIAQVLRAELFDSELDSARDRACLVHRRRGLLQVARESAKRVIARA